MKRALTEKERRDDIQRGERIATNEVRCEAARLGDAAEKDTTDIVVTKEMTGLAEQPSDTPSSSGTFRVNNVEEDAFLPNSNYSLSNPSSKESPMIIHDTVLNREKIPSESPTSKESLQMIHKTVGNKEKTKAAIEVDDE